MILTSFSVLYQHLSTEAEENHNETCHHNRAPFLELNAVLHIYKV